MNENVVKEVCSTQTTRLNDRIRFLEQREYLKSKSGGGGANAHYHRRDLDKIETPYLMLLKRIQNDIVSFFVYESNLTSFTL